ncbi:hypothetical protein Bca4012_041295 [Brassica carinata]
MNSQTKMVPHKLHPLLTPEEPAKTVPECGLLDIISSNRSFSLKENNQGGDNKQALSESDVTAGWGLGVSVSSNKPPDVEGNTTRN